MAAKDLSQNGQVRTRKKEKPTGEDHSQENKTIKASPKSYSHSFQIQAAYADESQVRKLSNIGEVAWFFRYSRIINYHKQLPYWCNNSGP